MCNPNGLTVLLWPAPPKGQQRYRQARESAQIAPAWRNSAMSASLRPSARRMASVCSPMAGTRVRRGLKGMTTAGRQQRRQAAAPPASPPCASACVPRVRVGPDAGHVVHAGVGNLRQLSRCSTQPPTATGENAAMAPVFGAVRCVATGKARRRPVQAVAAPGHRRPAIPVRSARRA